MEKIDRPLVSIIVPVYNVEKYIDECLVSIVNQTYTNLEIILVDDATTDSSDKKCDEWKNKDKRIKVVHKKKNEGLFQARITGYEIMTGDYFTTVDSDDRIAHDFVEKFMEASRLSEAELVLSNTLATFDDNKHDRIVFPNIYPKQKVLEGLMRNIANKKYGWSAYNKLYKVNVYKLARADLLSVKKNINASEDLLFAIIFAYYSGSAMYINDEREYYSYRQNPESIMGNISNESLVKRLDDITTVFFEIENFLLSLNIRDKYMNEISIVKKWHLSENVKHIAEISKVELQERNSQLQDHNSQLQERNSQLQDHNSQLQERIEAIVTSKTYTVGRFVAYPYLKIRNIIKTRKKPN